MGFGAPHLGIGGFLLLLVLSLVFHRNLFTLFSSDSAPDRPVASSGPEPNAAQDTEVEFVSFVLDDVQRTWQNLLPAQGGIPYRHAKLVLFRDSTPSACGQAASATGPFYCPGDEKVYLDLGFFDELKDRFGAPGEFAQAYVIAHEIGHHVQKLLGIEGRVQRMREANPEEANPLSVGLELQADCFAGVWAKSTEQKRSTRMISRQRCRRPRQLETTGFREWPPGMLIPTNSHMVHRDSERSGSRRAWIRVRCPRAGQPGNPFSFL